MIANVVILSENYCMYYVFIDFKSPFLDKLATVLLIIGTFNIIASFDYTYQFRLRNL